MPLHDPARHVQLAPSPWDPERARAWLQRWSAAALAEHKDHTWPLHPRDAADCEGATWPMKCMYFGATGVWLALARVAAAELCTLPAPLADILRAMLAGYQSTPDTGERVPSWFIGESALLTACCLARPEPALADRLMEVIRGNRDNPTREALWGAPGTMHAALCMYEATGEPRWADAFRDSAEALWSTWQHDDTRDVWLWEQDLYGSRVRYLGAGHGWAGNLHPLWRGQQLLDAQQRAQLRERTVQGLEKFALVDGELANWPPILGDTAKMLVQWCHGAPGFITSLRHAELPEALPLLLQGAALIVRAGPLSKGVGLCHGTDGNGAALLEIHRRTGDALWLERARQFATWSIEQSEAERAHHGQWRHSLWTGDAGLACFLLDCLAGASRGMPGLDVLW